MTKHLFVNILMLFFVGIISLAAQPKGALAPKERAIEDEPEDSVAAAVYKGMSYEQMMAIVSRLKVYDKNEPVPDLQKKEEELFKVRDTAWMLAIFMENPIKKREAESVEKEAHRVKLLNTLKDAQDAQAALKADRESRFRALDSLANLEWVDSLPQEVVADTDHEEWFGKPQEDETPPTTSAPKEEEANKDIAKGNKKGVAKEKKAKKDTSKKKDINKAKVPKKEGKKDEQTAKSKSDQEIVKKILEAREKKGEAEIEAKAKKEKERQDKEKEKLQLQEKQEKKQAKNEKKQAKFIEKEKAALEKAAEDSTKMEEYIQSLEDSSARYMEELKSFEDSTELMRANLKPIKILCDTIRNVYARMHYDVIDRTDVLGKEAEEDFNALIDDFHNRKVNEVEEELKNTELIERIKTLRDDIFLSRKIPNINCNGGIGNFMKIKTLRESATEEDSLDVANMRQEIEKIWEEIGKQMWQTTEKNKQKTREISSDEYKAIGRSTDCLGYILGLGDDCNLVILKLIDKSKIAIVCTKNKEDDMSTIKLIK